MGKMIAFALLCILFTSCGSHHNDEAKSNIVNIVNINPYKMSKGADTALSMYNTLASGKACYEPSFKEMLWATTMPSYCYLLTGKLFPNSPDTPVTVGAQFTDTNNAFACNWMRNGLADWGLCHPVNRYWPIDTITYPSSDGEITTWIVPQTAYRNIVPKVNINFARNPDTLFKAGLIYIPAKNIVGLSKWGIEDSLGFCARTLHTSYTNLFCSAGVTLQAIVKGSNNNDSAIDCYLVIDNDLGTMRWKDTIAVIGPHK